MPQLTKGGKFVFGLSQIAPNFTIQIPPQAHKHYRLGDSDKIILFTGSKATGGFCVTSNALLEGSKLEHILQDCSALAAHTLEEGAFTRYKGRGYAWLSISPTGLLQLPAHTADYLDLRAGERLMCIKSSDIAFTMGARGRLMDRLNAFKGEIECY